jgi:hypothetical protein
MQTGNTLRFAGDVSIDKVRIITQTGFYQDITAQVLAVHFYEDIFAPFISGSLVVKESLDLINLFPFIGEEYLDLQITTPTLEKNPIRGKYYIYKLTDRQLVGDRSVVYQLHFISVEAVTDLNKKTSRVYADKISNLIEPFIKDKTIGLESEKQVYIEDTLNNTKYISNFWSPTKNIMWLVDSAINKNKTPNYVFFENRDGFYFISLESLYSNQPYQEFVYDKFASESGSNIDIEKDYKRITSYSIPVAYDYIDRINNGMLASKMIAYDVTKKTYSSKNYSMFDRFAQQKHLNTYPINSDSAIFRSNSYIMNMPKYFGNFNGFGDVTNAKHIQERLSLLKIAEANKIQITVPGRTDYTVGLKVFVRFNRIEPVTKKDDDITDKIFSGYYIISAINHSIDREKHECHIELIKDSSLMNMNKGK